MYFLLVLSADHITGATGKSPTVTILKSGASSYVTPSGTVSEVANGVYQVAANATDAAQLGPLLLHATAAACDPVNTSFEVVQDLSAAAVALSPASTTTNALTALSLISGAMRLIGTLASGETPGSAESADALQRLNELLDGWATERLLVPSTTRTLYALTANKGTYTIGPGGDFNQAWPEVIARAGISYTVGTLTLEYPIRVLTVGEYAAIGIKALTSGFPGALYYDHAYSNGLGNISLWLVPDGTFALNLVLYTPATLSQFASLKTAYAFPPGYAKALRYNLAVDLAPEYGKPADSQLLMAAAESKANIKRANTPLVDLPCDPLILGRSQSVYNIWSDG